MSRRAGAIVRVDGVLAFLPTETLRRFVSSPAISDVSGTGWTMALVDGQVLTVVTVGVRRSALAVCELAGELVGLLGVQPECVGFFEAEPGGVSYAGDHARTLDVAAVVTAAALGRNGRFEVDA